MKKASGIILMSLLALVLMTATSATSRKEKGIEFAKMSFEKAKKQADKSGKLIFIDAYTDWCGPCKKMAATSFKDEEVGEVFNDNFVNLKIEMEKNPDGRDIARQYRVRAYPTLLIVDGQGNLVKQVVGFQSKDRLLALAESVL